MLHKKKKYIYIIYMPTPIKSMVCGLLVSPNLPTRSYTLFIEHPFEKNRRLWKLWKTLWKTYEQIVKLWKTPVYLLMDDNTCYFIKDIKITPVILSGEKIIFSGS